MTERKQPCCMEDGRALKAPGVASGKIPSGERTGKRRTKVNRRCSVERQARFSCFTPQKLGEFMAVVEIVSVKAPQM